MWHGRIASPSFFFRLTLLIGLGFWLVSSSPTVAQNSAENKISVSISPVLFEITANPGDTVDNVIKVTNSADKPQQIIMTVEPFTGTESGEAVIQEKGNPAYSLQDWVTFLPAEFSVNAKETKVISYKIAIPKNAEPGGRYGSFLASTPETKIAQGTGVATIQRVGTLVLLSVSGAIDYRANVVDFAATHRLFAEAPITFRSKIHNDSTVHIKPKGFVTIANMFGKKVTDVEVKPVNILPNENRIQDIQWNGPARIGHYSASLLLVYGDKNAQLSAVTDFYVFPWRKAIPYLIILLILLYFIITHRRRLKVALKILFSSRQYQQ